MMLVPIRNRSGETVAYSAIDDDGSDIVLRHRWCFHSRGYIVSWVGGKTELLHRLVMGVTDPRVRIDHIDRDKLNNVRSNLRLCNASTNGANRPAQSNNTSGYKGVTWNVRDQCWRAGIEVGGKFYFIGNYGCKIDAALAYDAQARARFGDFCRCNFQDGATIAK